MLYRFLTPVLMLAILGCDSKEYKKSSNSNIDLVSELNSGNSKVVISKLTSKNSLSPREQYYLASAYSSEGGIDVFSLYSVLELQLFRKNALEWSDISKEQNPYLRFMKTQEGINQEDRKKKRKERWAQYEPRIIARNNFRLEKPSLEDLKKEDQWATESVTLEKYAVADAFCGKKFEEIMKLPQDLDRRSEAWDEFENIFVYREKSEENPVGREFMLLTDHYSSRIRFETMKANYLHPENQKSIFGGVKWEMLYMNILWNTYEAIPIMKQMPTLTDAQQENVSKAPEEYRKLLHVPEFKDVAIKNLSVLAGVSLLSIYNSSFDFDEVQDATDLMCTFQAQSLVTNYSLIRKRILFLADIIEEPGEIKELAQYRDQIKAFKDSFPEELAPEQSEKYFSDIEEFRLKSCFNN